MTWLFGSPLMPLWMLFAVAIPLVIVGLLVALVVGIFRRLAEDRSPATTPPAPPTLTQRLAELDALLAAGTITPEEHRAARARLLGTL